MIRSAEMEEQLPLRPSDSRTEVIEKVVRESKKGIKLTAFNLLSACIGVATIGVPYGISMAGIGMSAALMVLITFLTDYTLRILIKAARNTETYNYQELAYLLLGRTGYAFVSLNLIAISGFSIINHNISIADNVMQLLKLAQQDSTYNIVTRPIILLITTTTVVLPLSLYRHVGDIGKYGVLSLFSVFILIISMVVATPWYLEIVPHHADDWILVKSTTFPRMISLYIYAIMSHHVALQVYRSLENGSNERWAIVTRSVCSTSFCVYVIIGFISYASFRSFTQGNVLENYCVKYITSIVARTAFTASLLLTVHVEIFVCREAVNTSCFPTFKKDSLGRHICVTLVLLYGLYGASLITDCLDIPLAINGTLSCIPIGCLFPSILYMKSAGSTLDKWEKTWNIILVILSTFLLIYEMTTILQRIILSGVSCNHNVVKFYCYSNKTLLHS